MKCANGIKLDFLDNYVKTLFEMESKMIDKDCKIAMLEFELSIEKELTKALKGYFPKKRSYVNLLLDFLER